MYSFSDGAVAELEHASNVEGLSAAGIAAGMSAALLALLLQHSKA